MLRVRTKTLAAGLTLAIGTVATISVASNQVVLETISDYTFFSGGSTGNNTDANTEGAGFWNAITAAGTPWTAGVWYYDNSVYDTDFYDPQLTGNGVDNDNNNFDRAGTGISFFIGHGTCDDATNTQCSTNNDCDPGHTGNSYCPNFPLSPGQNAACINNVTRKMVTSSTNSSHGNLVRYGNGAVSMAFGESPNSGTFDNVGTNGGSNVVIIVNSCGFRSHYITPVDSHQPRFYAGVHEIMFNMPVGNIKGASSANTADTAQWGARGSTLANLILANTNAPASTAWLTPSFVNNNYFGAGANVVGAFDTNSTTAQTRINNETWVQSTQDTRDATSAGGGFMRWTCTFSNCSAYTL